MCLAGAAITSFMEADGATTTLSVVSQSVHITTEITSGMNVAGDDYTLHVYLSASEPSDPANPPTPVGNEHNITPENAAAIVAGTPLQVDGTADLILPSIEADCSSVSHVCIKLTYTDSIVYSVCYQAQTNCGKLFQTAKIHFLISNIFNRYCKIK